MHRLLRYVLVLGVSFMLGVQAQESSAKPFGAIAHKSIVGTWQFKESNNGLQQITFLKDGTYELDFEGDGQRDIWGEYRISQDWLILNDTGGDFVFDCGQQGAYTYKIEDNVLSFRLMADQCPSRVQALGESWVRVENTQRIIEPPVKVKI